MLQAGRSAGLIVLIHFIVSVLLMAAVAARLADLVDRIEMNITEGKMSDAAIEQEIQAKGKTAARVTPEDIEAAIFSEHYFTAAHGVEGAMAKLELHQSFSDVDTLAGEHSPALNLGLLTFCVLVLKNGFTVTGESACASPENFDAEIGRKFARANAVNKIWPLEGYLLKQRLHETASRG